MGERHVDAAAVERTITVYGDLLYRIALHHLKTREDAEDVAHDVFVKWLEKAPVFYRMSTKKRGSSAPPSTPVRISGGGRHAG